MQHDTCGFHLVDGPVIGTRCPYWMALGEMWQPCSCSASGSSCPLLVWLAVQLPPVVSLALKAAGADEASSGLQQLRLRPKSVRTQDGGELITTTIEQQESSELSVLERKQPVPHDVQKPANASSGTLRPAPKELQPGDVTLSISFGGCSSTCHAWLHDDRSSSYVCTVGRSCECLLASPVATRSMHMQCGRSLQEEARSLFHADSTVCVDVAYAGTHRHCQD